MPRITPSNSTIAALLHRVGDVLAAQDANAHRVRAYHRAAETVRIYPSSVGELVLKDGRHALEALPTIGERIASSIDEIAHTGSLRMLDRLEGQFAPEEIFASIPGIGEELAHRIHDELHIDTLEDLEVAAYDGRLDGIHGIGRERVEAVKGFLERNVSRTGRSRSRARRLSLSDVGPNVEFDHDAHPLPTVDVLLDLDARYRGLAERGSLSTVAPTRFNPDRKRWLPIWHPERDGWSFTVLFSNSAVAHRLGKTHDWVVIYFEQDGEEEQCTVVTEYRGELRSQRIVRGREAECLELYRHQEVDGSVKSWAHRQLEELEKS